MDSEDAMVVNCEEVMDGEEDLENSVSVISSQVSTPGLKKTDNIIAKLLH